MISEIEIVSKIFPQESKDETINDHRFGKKLAEYIANLLVKNGIDVNDLYPEDWGYEIAINKYEFDVYIGCGNNENEVDGFIIFISPNKPVIRKWFKKISTVEIMGKISSILVDDLRENPEISIRTINGETEVP